MIKSNISYLKWTLILQALCWFGKKKSLFRNLFWKGNSGKGINIYWDLTCARYTTHVILILRVILKGRCYRPLMDKETEVRRNLNDMSNSIELVRRGAKIPLWVYFMGKQVPFHLRSSTFHINLPVSSNFIRLASTDDRHFPRMSCGCSWVQRSSKGNWN